MVLFSLSVLIVLRNASDDMQVFNEMFVTWNKLSSAQFYHL